MDSARVLVSGASGLIGQAAVAALSAEGYKVSRLTRSQAQAGDVQWDPSQPLSPTLVSGFDAVVHLAGESIVGRWTDAKKKRIRESRVLGTRNLAQALAKASQRPSVLVCASAVGYYGSRGDEVLREDSSSGNDFLSEVCREWESAASPARNAGIRTVHTRFGLVLSNTGGALQKMLLPFRFGVGGRVGSGKQWWSWVDLQDVAGGILHAIKSNLQGPVNFVAPNPATNIEFTKVLGSVLSRPTIFPVPAFAARLAFGQMADGLLLASQRVEAVKLKESGYQFKFASLKKSLEAILNS
ncbi:MAG TPA: TIGR01777 family oxidoreductase [Terriglobales bacterium]|jgi:uncharacterized protein (TIGR01777 family)